MKITNVSAIVLKLAEISSAADGTQDDLIIKVETDEGDMHFAYTTRKTYLIERKRFYEMLQNATIGLKNSEIMLNEYQLKQINGTLSPNKPRKQVKQN